MYNESDESELGSKRLAQICLEEVTGQLQSRNRGLVEGDSIYIIRTSKVPVALIEVGFMTNQQELDLLRSEDYQKKQHLVSIMRYCVHLKKDISVKTNGIQGNGEAE